MKTSFFVSSWKYILTILGFCLFCFPPILATQIDYEGDFMEPLYIKTPLLESSAISKKTGRQIFLKMEALQPTGSFKIRGIGHLCSQLARNGARRFVTSSAGNGGLAVAYAGSKLNIPVTVVVWNTVSEIIHEKLRRQGAKVVVHGNDWMEANNLAQSMCEEKDVCYVHPFDHPLIWEGHASLIHEVKASGIKPDAVVVAVGGGGLLCGVIQGLHEVGWSELPVFTAETSGAASLAKSVKARKLIMLDKIDTIALSLGARCVAEQAFKWTQEHLVIPLEVSDAQAVDAVLQFADDQRILVEPACGAALAIVYDKHSDLMKYEKILVIVCGGCNVDLDLLEKWKKIFEKK